jgi:hypothetical protein
MKRLGLRLVTMVLAIAGSASLPASAAQAPPEEMLRHLIRTATAEMPAMAALFDWDGQVEWQEGGALDTNVTRVSLDPQEIGRLIAAVESHDQQNAVRMIVAHEVWHFVEFRRGSVPAVVADGDERRIQECRADMMAARYIASADRDAANATLEAGPPQSIARQLWRAATPDHPTPAQRARAAQFGSLLILRERQDLQEDVQSAVDLRLGLREGELLPAWSRRVCEQIVQAQRAAVNRVLISYPERFQRDGKSFFRLSYTNSSPRNLVVFPTILATARETAGASPEHSLYHSWTFPEQLRLRPGLPVTVERELTGLRSPDTYVIFNARDDDALISARFGSGLGDQAAWMIAEDLPPGDIEMALAIQALANDAANGFSQFRGGGATLVGSNLSVNSTLSIPGANYTWITADDSGRAQVNATMYSGKSSGEAAAALADLVARLRRIWPAAKYSQENGSTHSIRVSRYAEVTVSLSSTALGFTVFLSVEPRLLGLVE